MKILSKLIAWLIIKMITLCVVFTTNAQPTNNPQNNYKKDLFEFYGNTITIDNQLNNIINTKDDGKLHLEMRTNKHQRIKQNATITHNSVGTNQGNQIVSMQLDMMPMGTNVVLNIDYDGTGKKRYSGIILNKESEYSYTLSSIKNGKMIFVKKHTNEIICVE